MRADETDERDPRRQAIALDSAIRGIAQHLRARLSRPDRVEAVMDAFRKDRSKLAAEGSPTKDLAG